MTIIEGDGWKLQWGLFWTWPHIVDHKRAMYREYYFGPYVFEATYIWLVKVGMK